MKNEYKGCECSHLIDRITSTSTAKDIGEMQKNLVNLVKKMEDFYQNGGDSDEEGEDIKPDVTCASKDYSDALSVDATFLNQLADKFCSGDTNKKRSQDLTAKDVSSSAYADYKFHFELDPGKDCEMDCKAAFKSMTSTCTIFSPSFTRLYLGSPTDSVCNRPRHRQSQHSSLCQRKIHILQRKLEI